MKVKNNIDKTEFKFSCEFDNQVENTIVEVLGANNPNLPTLVRVKAPEKFKIDSPCSKFNQCGACRLLNMEYSEQLNVKTQTIKAFLGKKFAGNVNHCIGMFYPFKFRNKLTFAVKKLAKGISVGFYQEDSKNVIDVDNCLIHDSFAKIISDEIKKYIKLSKIYAYDDEKLTGLLRYVVVRNDGSSVMVVLVVTSQIVPGLNDFYKSLKTKFKNVSLYLNINTSDSSLLLSDTFIHKYGETALFGNFCGVTYTLKPGSFMQTNAQIATKIYKKVQEEISTKAKGHIVIDAFSGIGITSLLFAKTGAEVYAIELSKSASSDAKQLAVKNNLDDKIKIINGNCTQVLPEILAENANATVFIDPPRSGLSVSIINSFLTAKPKKIIYLSCNPVTMSSNLSALITGGYKIKYIQPYDMFPHSKHIECLCVLERF